MKDEIEDLIFVRELHIPTMPEISASWQRMDNIDDAKVITVNKKVYRNIYITDAEYRHIFGVLIKREE